MKRKTTTTERSARYKAILAPQIAAMLDTFNFARVAYTMKKLDQTWWDNKIGDHVPTFIELRDQAERMLWEVAGYDAKHVSVRVAGLAVYRDGTKFRLAYEIDHVESNETEKIKAVTAARNVSA